MQKKCLIDDALSIDIKINDPDITIMDFTIEESAETVTFTRFYSTNI